MLKNTFSQFGEVEYVGRKAIYIEDDVVNKQKKMIYFTKLFLLTEKKKKKEASAKIVGYISYKDEKSA